MAEKLKYTETKERLITNVSSPTLHTNLVLLYPVIKVLKSCGTKRNIKKTTFPNFYHRFCLVVFEQ